MRPGVDSSSHSPHCFLLRPIVTMGLHSVTARTALNQNAWDQQRLRRHHGLCCTGDSGAGVPSCMMQPASAVSPSPQLCSALLSPLAIPLSAVWTPSSSSCCCLAASLPPSLPPAKHFHVSHIPSLLSPMSLSLQNHLRSHLHSNI